jgi:hypothetical protein
MALAVCLLFDIQGDRTIRRLWARLEAQGVPTPLTHTHGRHRPHLSLVVLRTWELTAVTDALAHLPAGDPLHLSIPGTLAFPRGRAALAVAVGEDLVRRQQAAALAVRATGADLHHHYLPGRWLPHVAIATGGNAARLPTVVRTVNDALPIVAEVVHAGLVDSGTGEFWPLGQLP